MSTAPIVKRIVCLANSRKPGGRCVAGKEYLPDGCTGEWIRPIGAGSSEAVSEQERRYQDGSDPQVLDVIEIALAGAQPKNYQQENWRIDGNRSWRKLSRFTSSWLQQNVDSPMPLWPNDSSSLGFNDRIPLQIANGLSSSLRLIHVNNLVVSSSAPGNAQGSFSFNGAFYRLRVTDPGYHRQYIQQFESGVQINDCYLTISLGEPFQGHSYKLIAAIIPV